MRYPRLTKQSSIFQREVETLRTRLENNEKTITKYTEDVKSCNDLNNELRKQLEDYQKLYRRIREISGLGLENSAPSDEYSVLLDQVSFLLKRNRLRKCLV